MIVYYRFKNSRQELREASFPIRCVWVPPWQGGWEGEVRAVEVPGSAASEAPSLVRGEGPRPLEAHSPHARGDLPSALELRTGQMGVAEWMNE